MSQEVEDQELTKLDPERYDELQASNKVRNSIEDARDEVYMLVWIERETGEQGLVKFEDLNIPIEGAPLVTRVPYAKAVADLNGGFPVYVEALTLNASIDPTDAEYLSPVPIVPAATERDLPPTQMYEITNFTQLETLSNVYGRGGSEWSDTVGEDDPLAFYLVTVTKSKTQLFQQERDWEHKGEPLFLRRPHVFTNPQTANRWIAKHGQLGYSYMLVHGLEAKEGFN